MRSVAAQEEVSRHEPVSALDGGPSTGVRDLLAVCSQAGDMLAQGGFLGLETLGEPLAAVQAWPLTLRSLVSISCMAPKRQLFCTGQSGMGVA